MISQIRGFFKKYDGIALDGMLLATIRIITLLVSIVQTMYLSRALSFFEYGTYSALNIVISLLITFTSFGMSNSITYFYNIHNDQTERKEYINSIFTLTLIIGFIGAITCLLFREQIASYYSNEVVATLMIYVAFRPLLDNLIKIFDPLYISLKKAKIIALKNLIIAIIKVLAIPISYIIFHNLKAILIVQLILDILQLIIFNFDVQKHLGTIKYFSIKWTIAKKILKYSIPLYLALMCGTLFKEADKLLIAKMASIEDLAIYTNMSKPLPFEYIVVSFTTIITPIMVKYLNGEKNKAINLWKVFMEFSYVVSWILTFGAIVCSKELLFLLYSKAYYSGISIFIVYLVAEVFKFTYFGLILSSSGETKYITISSVVALVLNIILNIILYKLLGIIGPAIATLITSIVMNTMQFIISCRLLNTSIFKILEFKNIFKTTIVLSSVGIILYFLKNLLYNIISNYVVILFVIYGLYLIISMFIFKKKIISLITNLK